MRDIVNGRWRTIRGGRLGVPPRRRVPPAVQRRRDIARAQEEAKASYPVLQAKLDKIEKRMWDARASGKRFAYKKPLTDLYKMAHYWNEKGKLDAFVRRVANLRAIPIRSNANPFSVLVKALLGNSADRKTVSRWSVQLKKAMDDNVPPSDLDEHI